MGRDRGRGVGEGQRVGAFGRIYQEPGYQKADSVVRARLILGT